MQGSRSRISISKYLHALSFVACSMSHTISAPNAKAAEGSHSERLWCLKINFFVVRHMKLLCYSKMQLLLRGSLISESIRERPQEMSRVTWVFLGPIPPVRRDKTVTVTLDIDLPPPTPDVSRSTHTYTQAHARTGRDISSAAQTYTHRLHAHAHACT